MGRNQLQVSGNVGYSSRAGSPTAGFRTSYSRDDGGPEIAVTMQQVFLPARASLAEMTGQTDGAPALRTMAISMQDKIAISDDLRLDYGMSLNSVSFLDHLNYMSKFARLSYDLDNAGTVQLAYSSGAPPSQLLVEEGRGNETYVRGDQTALAEDLAALSVLPRLSLLNGRGAVERSQDFEIGYEKKLRSTIFNLTGYRETVTNASMTIAAPAGDAFALGDVLPDISSKSSILNIGSFQRTGFAASMTKSLGDRIQLGASAGRGGALELGRSRFGTGDRGGAAVQYPDYAALLGFREGLGDTAGCRYANQRKLRVDRLQHDHAKPLLPNPERLSGARLEHSRAAANTLLRRHARPSGGHR